jgi:hypothetical protein
MLKSSIRASCVLPGKGMITADEPVQIVALPLSKLAMISHPSKIKAGQTVLFKPPAH